MASITRKTTELQIALTAYVAGLLERPRRDEGQASTEYAGILFVIVAIITAVVAAVTPVGAAIVSRITTAIGNVGGAG